MATGASYDEALLHSVLEIIERDAYSYFLIDTFILNKPVTLIHQDSLPPDIREIVTRIEKAFSDKLVIIKMPSRFDVPVYCVTFFRNKYDNQPRGAGASLSAHYALERAIYECVQSYTLMHGDYLSKDMYHHDMTAFKVVQDSIQFPMRQLLKEKRCLFDDFTNDFATSLEIKQQLKILMDKVYSHSKVLVNKVYEEEGVACVRAIIPEAEEFFLITHCLKMLPNDKTQKYIETELGEKFSWDYLARGEKYG